MSNNLDLDQLTATQTNKTTTINDQAGQLDAAITETLSVDFTSGNVVLTNEQFRRAFEFEAANLSVARTLTVPAIKRFFYVNNEAGTAILSVVRGTTSIDIAAGENGLFRTNGTANGMTQSAGGGGGGVNFDALDWKQSVRVAATGNVDITTGLENGDSLEGATLATGDRVLLPAQTVASQNGIYTVVASGAASRSTDADDNTKVTSGLAVHVEEGSTNADTFWYLSTNNPITLDTTALTFTQFGSGGSTTFTGLTDTPANFTGAGGQRPRVNSGETALAFESIVKPVGSFVGGVPTVSVSVLSFVAVEPITFPSGLTNSGGFAGTAPNAQTDFDIRKNGVSVGTMGFANASQTPVFTMASATSFAIGDRLEVIAPANLNTLANLMFTLRATEG